jgi:signal transduction histidine kinase
MVVQLRDGHLEPFLFWTAVGVVLLLTARQIVVLLENMTLTHHLEQRVEARTAELAAALRDVEKARALQDAFVASISHELKTPLTNILGATATMLRPEIGLTEAQRSMTEVAQRGASRLVRMVDDLLLVSAIADAPSAETVEPFDVADTIVAAVEESTSSGPRVYVNAPQRLRALGDRESLILILAKLLDNARRFTEPGSSIWIDAFRRGELVEVVVRDEGPGIPAAFQERVFDRFFQIDSATTRAYDGAGLGLFIARTLAERMGAHLSLDPSSKDGASFRLTMRVASDRQPAMA